MSAKKTTMKILTIFIIVIFLLATGGIVVLYLSQPTPEWYNEYRSQDDALEQEVIDQVLPVEEVEDFTWSLEEFWQ